MKNGDQAGVGKKPSKQGPATKRAKRRREQTANRQTQIEGRRAE